MTLMVDKYPHEWVKSEIGHGNFQCVYCYATDCEIEVIGDMNHCPDNPAIAEAQALIAEAQQEGAPMRCAECDCESGGADCTWIAQQEDTHAR